jgi:hypothetical protein
VRGKSIPPHFYQLNQTKLIILSKRNIYFTTLACRLFNGVQSDERKHKRIVFRRFDLIITVCAGYGADLRPFRLTVTPGSWSPAASLTKPLIYADRELQRIDLFLIPMPCSALFY